MQTYTAQLGIAFSLNLHCFLRFLHTTEDGEETYSSFHLHLYSIPFPRAARFWLGFSLRFGRWVVL